MSIFHTLMQDWRRRYFILKGSRLFFAKTPYEAPHGMIDLSRCTTVKSADIKAHKKHSFEISTPDTTYLLYAGERNYIIRGKFFFDRCNNVFSNHTFMLCFSSITRER
jgi:hypothetical protein